MGAVRPERDLAVEFLRSHGHFVTEFSGEDKQCYVDRVLVCELGVIRVAESYGNKWFDYLNASRRREATAAGLEET